jgi:peptidoglycan/LPS O-acetylase OafA/YrhL
LTRPDGSAEAHATTDGSEVRSLTGLRAVLAWWVVVFHFARDFFPDDWPILKSTVSGGYVAVDVFFVLSGYVLMRRYRTMLWTPLGVRAFYVRRWARVYPVYASSLALGAIASFGKFAADCTNVRGLTRIALEFLLLNAWHHVAMFQYNFAAWSLSVEAFFYLLCPLLLPLVARQSQRALATLLGLSWLAMFIVPTLYTALDPDHLGRALILGDEKPWSWYLKFFPLQRLPQFLAGAVAATWKGRAPTWAWIVPGGALMVLGLRTIPYAYLTSGVLLPLFVLFIVVIAAHDRRALSSRALVALGRASFTTYILHWPLFLLWSRVDRSIWERPSHVALFACALCAMSLTTFRFVEEPLRRRLTGNLSH